jgi:arylsulfatase A-like enzyme
MVRKNRGVRTDRWKYIHYFEDPQEYELYDLVADPGENNNLYGNLEFAPIVENLRQRMTELRRETSDPDLKKAVPTNNGASLNP